jgi:hypothetical protein
VNEEQFRADLRLGGVLASSTDRAGTPPRAAADPSTTFQVVYQASDRLIVGVGPFGAGTDFGPDYPITTLDVSQQRAVLDNPTAYLCADGATVRPNPC